MKKLQKFALSAVLGALIGTMAIPATPVIAETPQDMLVIANRIDDITTPNLSNSLAVTSFGTSMVVW